MLLEPSDDTLEIRIATAKAPSEPVPAALDDLPTVREYIELALLTRRRHGIKVEAVLNEGHETRDLGLVVLSGRAVDDLDLHWTSTLSYRVVNRRLGWPQHEGAERQLNCTTESR